MAAKYQEFVTEVRLNSEQAKNKLQQLRKETEEWIKKRNDLINGKGSTSEISNLTKNIQKNERVMGQLEKQAHNIIDTLDNLDGATLNQLKQAERELNAEMRKTPQNTPYFHELADKLKQVKSQIAGIRDETKSAFVEQKQLADENHNLSNVMNNLKTSSLKELSMAETTLKKQMQEAKPDTDAYRQAAENLKTVHARIVEVNREQKEWVVTLDRYNEEIKRLEKEEANWTESQKIINNTINNLSSAKIVDMEYSVKLLNEKLKYTEQGTQKYKNLEKQLKQVKAQLQAVNREQEVMKSLSSRIINFFNKNWGVLTQGFLAFSLSAGRARKSVEDFAEMEEAMANTRKYTGLSDEAIRELNEDIKKIDTRTFREELNGLAGAAGRLGITSKNEIMDFVDAADKIKVALGDDLGEGAVDQIGKLAMAFGEDDRMGLRGAMLATGSAVNELAQNSSANAGYLVDFTARVAGFGKQLGLTQAQIMGFGAVMDENMLRDEMASTAFGNMLTKMQTDTAKFAKIAGMNVKEFTDLLNKDANQAILKLADSLKRADPQTMMKMLDDMGLDGSRAVGVLSTMADKIDDVRERQQLATEAYAKGTSVINEFATMNNTVEAKLEKARKQFHEVSVELGHQLMPVVQHLFTGVGLLTRGMNVLVGVVKNYSSTIIRLSLLIATLTTLWNLHTIKVKIATAAKASAIAVEKGWQAAAMFSKNVMLALQLAWTLCTKGVQAYTVALRAAKIASLTNPWTALATVLLTVGVAVYELVSAFGKETDAARKARTATEDFNSTQKLLRSVNEEANQSVSEEIVKFKQLRKTLEDNKKGLDERKKALDEIKKICPEYHGQLTTENRLINSNTTALDGYVNNLVRAARAQAAFNKMVKLQENTMSHEELLNNRQDNQAWVKNQLAKRGYVDGAQLFAGNGTRNSSWEIRDKEGNVIKQITQEQAEQILHLRKIQTYNERRIKEEQTILNLNSKQSEVLQNIVNDGNLPQKGQHKTESPNLPKEPVNYTTDAEREAAARRLKEAEKDLAEKMKEQADAARGAYQEELAMEMLSYRQGLQSYTNYMESKHKLTQDYYTKLKDIYGENSNEYKKALLQQENDEQEYSQWQMKQKDDSLIYDKLERDHNIRMQYATKELQDESTLNEALFQSDMTYLKQKQNLYKKGSKEWVDIEMQIQEENRNHQYELEQDWLQRLSQYRQEAGLMDYQKLQEAELKGVETFYGALVKAGRMTQEEYDAIVEHIKRKYAESSADQQAYNNVKNKASSALDTAKKKAGIDDVTAGNDAVSGIYSINQAITHQKLVNEQLKALYGEDYENNKEYQEAKKLLDAETMDAVVAGAQAAYSTISSFMSAASSYSQACSDLEVAKITANYDKQIAAAGNNSRKKEILEQKKEKEIAKAKSKANKKAMKIELAQAVASTALAAINAYSSAVKIPVVGPTLAPIAAGIATAAGLLQIATIKKQHAAESAGYYEGGFTGGRNYRQQAGVVHQGEFVVNHDGVNNQNLLPVLRLLDTAQRNNTIGSLTSADVSRQLGQGGNVVAPVVNVQNDNEGLRLSIDGMNESIDRLNRHLDNPKPAVVSMEQLDREWERWNNIKKNV